MASPNASTGLPSAALGFKTYLCVALFLLLYALGMQFALDRLKRRKSQPEILHLTDQLYELPAGFRPPVPFVQLASDDQTISFLHYAREKQPSPLSFLVFKVQKLFRNPFEALAVSGASSMHILSGPQIRKLLFAAAAPSSFEKILDVGAGDGRATAAALLPLLKSGDASKLSCTETSTGMARLLRDRGFTVLEEDLADGAASSEKYGFVALFNVLDRCSRPLSLVSTALERLEEGGWLLLATPLPFRGRHWQGSKRMLQEEQLEGLPEEKAGWAVHALWLLKTALPQLGLEALAFSRVPYLSMGDHKHDTYRLDDIVVLCRKRQA